LVFLPLTYEVSAKGLEDFVLIEGLFSDRSPPDFDNADYDRFGLPNHNLIENSNHPHVSNRTTLTSVASV
jgi:hypothetical protein